MNKIYSLLVAAAICSAANGLSASERSEKSFFDEPTQKALKEACTDTALLYGLGCYFLHGGATGLGLVSGVMATDLDRYIAKKNKSDFSVIKSLRKEIPEAISLLNKGVARAHIVAVPLAISFTYNQYEKYKSYK